MELNCKLRMMIAFLKFLNYFSFYKNKYTVIKKGITHHVDYVS